MKPHLPLFRRGTKKQSEKNNRRLKVDTHRTGLAILTIVILSVLLSVNIPSKVSLEIGQLSPEDIYAHRTVRYENAAATDLRRAQAADTVREYDIVPNAADQAISALKQVFRAVETVRHRSDNLPVIERVTLVREQLGSVFGTKVSDESLSVLLTAQPAALREMEDTAIRLVSSTMGRQLRDDPIEMRNARELVMADAQRVIETDPAIATAVGEISRDALRPNRIFNEERTIAQQEKAKKSVAPEYDLIEKGELVIGKNEAVLQEHIDKFKALGLRNPSLDYRSVISLTAFVVIAVLLVAAYLWRYHNDVFNNTKTLTLLAFIVIICVFALRAGGSILGIKLTPEQIGYLGILWVVTAGMLISVLLNPQVAVVISAVLAVVVSMLLNNELRFAASALVTSLVGIFSVANIRGLIDLIRAGSSLATVGILLVWVMGGVDGDSFMEMLTGSVWAIIIAGVTPWLFLIGTKLLERPFGRTTHISMLELADTNKPLLRKLVMEAPGTYTHSMAVGHLAEIASESIGADSLVARVASYYHDIGKLRRPHFFIENQHVENVHDRMNPTLSALVITSHIKDGLDIAREYRLPRVVEEVIIQHHGTSLVQYFFSQCAGEQDPSTALEQQFRYSGPKPHTKEAAIVMLADSVEAASRAMSKPTLAKIEMLVNRIIAEKLRDGQLDECELTFREISNITSSFIKTLTSTMHARIEYPDAPGTEDKKLVANGNPDTELTKEEGQDNPLENPGAATSAN